MHDFRYESQRQRVLFGTGRAAELLAETLGRLRASRAMVIATARELRRSGEVLGGIRPALVFDEVVQHVPVETAERARRAAAEARIDVLVAVGGGSAIGLAKAVALTSGLPIVAVPTTYAGSEATIMWGLVDGDLKTTGSDTRVLPGTVIYDALLTLSLPRGLGVSSGLNALAHGVDSLWAPGANPVSALIATESIRVLAESLPAITAESGSVSAEGQVAAREQALYGAYLAASAFSATGSGLHHKICHVLGGTFGMPHSETHAVVLPHVVALNAPAAHRAEERIAAALGGDRSAVGGLLALHDRLGAPTSLRAFGFREADIARAAERILPAVPASNPRAVTREALTLLLHAAWAGDAPPAG